MHARTADEAEAALLRLVDDPQLRERIERAAHEHVARYRTIQAVAPAWREVLREVA